MAEKKIWVKAANENGRVALWEANEAHPGGEAYVTGDGRSVLVARTGAVVQKLNSGDLALADAPSEPEPEPEPEPAKDDDEDSGTERLTAAAARAAKLKAQQG
jgi:hypothetical protein